MAVCVPLQLVFLRGQDLTSYERTRLMPSDGAFIEDAAIPVSCNLEELRAALLQRLDALEGYRAATRGVPPRAGAVGAVFSELQDGRLVRLLGVGSIAVDSPVKDVLADRGWDTSWLANLPLDTVELILSACESGSDLHDLHSMRAASSTARAQSAPRRIRRMFVIVGGW